MMKMEENKDEEGFGFYGEEGDIEETKDIKGISDGITQFTYTNLSYPCILFNKDFKCPKHQLNVIKSMVESSIPTKDISLYFFNSNEELFKIGMIDGLQVKAFLEIIGVDNVKGYLSEDKILDGDLLYTLSTF